MSVLIKTVNHKKYAYLAYRAGDKVVHQYLCPMSKSSVIEKIKSLKKESRVPVNYYSFFWDTDPEKIDLKANKRYVIERILELGGLDAFEWLQRIYPTQRILETCESSRRLTAKSKLFWEIWMGTDSKYA